MYYNLITPVDALDYRKFILFSADNKHSFGCISYKDGSFGKPFIAIKPSASVFVGSFEIHYLDDDDDDDFEFLYEFHSYCVNFRTSSALYHLPKHLHKFGMRLCKTDKRVFKILDMPVTLEE